MRRRHIFNVVERTTRDRLGEGPVWIPSRGAVVWVDILGQVVNQLDLTSQVVSLTEVGEPIGWVLPRSDNPLFVAGFKSGVGLLDLDHGSYRIVARPEIDRPANRFNDAKVDPQGRIWAGTKCEDDEPTGAFYRIDSDFAWERVDDGYGVTNGPTFSSDGKVLYHTDSAARSVFAFDLDEDGHLDNKRIWLQFEDAWGYPDGMTTDAEGCIWIARWGGGGVSRFSPDGRLIRSIDLPATNITSCTFAGEALDRMFVTSSMIDCEHEELAGALFEVDPEVIGLPPTSFKG